ncbi:MAG: tryptophan synthase subunit alpha [Hydrogenophilus sp.]|nr:tryptophan synthase subunit alpha [Hydrogenophilus sp.]
MNRIDETFAQLKREGRCGLIPFLMAGDPDAVMTVELMHTAVAAGANVLEVGVPFSDPMADGPTVQRASERALASGMTLRQAIELVARFRRDDKITPVVLMGYLNPIETMGWPKFAETAAAAGVDGVLTVDLPPEEGEEAARILKATGIAPIFLLAPTSTEARARLAAERGGGYLYYVSLTGVTGAYHLDPSAAIKRLEEMRRWVGLPIAVGFGVRDASSASALAAVADAVVVGSRLLEEIERDPIHASSQVAEFLRSLRSAIDSRTEDRP